MMERKCRVCQVACPCPSIESWYTHLASPQHQAVAIDVFPPNGKWARTVVGWDFDDSLSTFPMKIMGLFADFGIIEDIYFRRLGKQFPVIIAVQVLLEKRQDAVKFVDHWNSASTLSSVKINLKEGIEEVRAAKFDIMERLRWGTFCRELVWHEKLLKGDLRHDMLLEKLATAPAEQHLQVFMDELSLSATDKELRIRTIENLERFVKQFFPSCKLHPFGSYLTGLGSPDSDIDIFVNVNEDMLTHGLTLESVMQLLYKELLRVADSDAVRDKSKKRFKDVVFIRHARIPIIRVVDKTTNIQLDLSFNSPISLSNSRLIKFYLDFDPIVKPVMMLVRYWADYHGLVDSNKIKSYGLNLMSIVYLNQEMIIPRIGYLQEVCTDKLIIDGCNVAFCDDIELVRQSIPALKSKPPNVADLRTVLSFVKEFLFFYGFQDLEENFLCTLHGTLANKILLQDQNLFENYLGAKVDVSKLCSGPLCIQDPFVLNVNVNSPSPDLVARFQRLCKETYIKLRDILKEPDRGISLLDIFPED